MTAPLVLGVLLDHTGPESPMTGEVRRVLDEAFAEGRLDRPVELVTEKADGLPRGTAAAVTRAFARLMDHQPLAILGPSITDNGLVARDLADRAEVPCLNWTGSDRTRSRWMFHYQIGSLEEEPFLLASYLAAQGRQRIVLVQDRSPIGNRYGAFFETGAERHSLKIVARTLISPVSEDLGDVVAELGNHECDAVVYLGLGLSAAAVGRAMAEHGWRPPVATNSALMFGWSNRQWAEEYWDDWTYVDAWSLRNERLVSLLGGEAVTPERSPLMVAAGDDMGRIVADALARAEHLTPGGVMEALETVKGLPAALGGPGTTMSFGHWDRAALKGEFLILRRWVGGASLEVDPATDEAR